MRSASPPSVGRIYNKTVQCKKKHVEWYPPLLAGAQRRPASTQRKISGGWSSNCAGRSQRLSALRQARMSDPDEVIDAELEAEDLPHIHSVARRCTGRAHLGVPDQTLAAPDHPDR